MVRIFHEQKSVKNKSTEKQLHDFLRGPTANNNMGESIDSKTHNKTPRFRQ